MKDSLSQLGPDRLALLIRVGLECDLSGEPRDESVAALLRAKLAGELPLDVSLADSLPAVLGLPCEGLRRYRGHSTAELLSNPRVEVNVLTTLKDYAKELVKRSRSEVTTAVATALYYAAIAAAMVFHEVKITRHGYSHLERSFAALLDKPWLTADLQTLLAGARRVCTMKLREEDPANGG